AFEPLVCKESNLVFDAGNASAALVAGLESPGSGELLIALGMGGMGYSFGAAVGACLANGRRTVVFAGDGAAFMNGMEMHTALEHELPITFVLLDNGGHAMCGTRHRVYFGPDLPANRFQAGSLAGGLAGMFPDRPVFAVETWSQASEAA